MQPSYCKKACNIYSMVLMPCCIFFNISFYPNFKNLSIYYDAIYISALMLYLILVEKKMNLPTPAHYKNTKQGGKILLCPQGFEFSKSKSGIFLCRDRSQVCVCCPRGRARMIGGGRSPTPIMRAHPRGQQTQTWLRSRHRNIILFLQTVCIRIQVFPYLPCQGGKVFPYLPSQRGKVSS